MRLVIVGLAKYPTETAGSHRMTLYYRILSSFLQVKILAVQHRVSKVCSSFFYGVDIEYYAKGIPENRLFDIINLRYWSLLFYLIKERTKYDSVLLYVRGFWITLYLFIFLKLVNKKIYFEVNEMPYSFNRSLMFWSNLKRFIYFTLFYTKSDGVIVISKNLQDYFINYYGYQRVLKIPILIDSGMRNLNEKQIKTRNHILSKKYIFHSGSFSDYKDGIILMIRSYISAAIELKSRNIDLFFVTTNFNAEKKIKKLIKFELEKNNLLDHFIITGFLDHNTLKIYQQYSTCLLLIKPYNLQNKYNFSTKLGDYLLSSRPVIAVGYNNEMFSYLKNNINAIVITEYSHLLISEMIVRCVNNPHLFSKIGVKGHNLAKLHFNYSKYQLQFYNFLRNNE